MKISKTHPSQLPSRYSTLGSIKIFFHGSENGQRAQRFGLPRLRLDGSGLTMTNDIQRCIFKSGCFPGTLATHMAPIFRSPGPCIQWLCIHYSGGCLEKGQEKQNTSQCICSATDSVTTSRPDSPPAPAGSFSWRAKTIARDPNGSGPCFCDLLEPLAVIRDLGCLHQRCEMVWGKTFS